MAKKILPLLLCLVILFTCAVTLLIGAEDTTAPEGNTTVGGETSTLPTGSVSEEDAAFHASLESKIPEKYSASEYPWAVFYKDGNTGNYTFVSAQKLFCHRGENLFAIGSLDSGSTAIAAINVARNTLVDKKLPTYILLRSDYKMYTKNAPLEQTAYFKKTGVTGAKYTEDDGKTWTTSPEVTYNSTTYYEYTHIYDSDFYTLAQGTGSLTIDLAGHEFDFNNASTLLAMQNRTNSNTALNISMKNGIIKNSKSAIFAISQKSGNASGETHRNINVTMENIDFTAASNASAGILTRSGTNTALKLTNATLTLRDCTLDLSDATSSYHLAVNKDNAGYVQVVIDGGEIISDSVTTGDISSCGIYFTDDSTKINENDSFVCNENVTVTGPGTCKYGTVPARYTDAQEYPFLVFADGVKTTGFQYWSSDSKTTHFTKGINNDNYKRKNVTVLLQRDYTAGSEDTVFNNFSQWKMTSLEFDLNGKTFNIGSIPFANINLKEDTISTAPLELTVNNGTLIASNNLVSVHANFKSNSTGAFLKYDAGTNITFTNVALDVGGDLAYSTEKIPEVTADNVVNCNPHPINVIFEDCTTDRAVCWDVKTNSSPYIAINISCKHAEEQSACDFCEFEKNAVINGYNVDLGSKLGLNFYVKDLSLVDTIKITVGGEIFEIKATDVEFDAANSAYKIHAEVSSIQTRETVKVEFFDENGNALAITAATTKGSKAYTTSVYTYLTTFTVRATEAEATKAAAAQALINYAAFAENYFTTKAGGTFDMATAFPTAQLDVVTGTDAALIKGTVIGTSEKLADANLVLNDATKIRINLTAAAKVEGGENIVYTEANGKYYVDICGIDAKNLDTVYTFTVDGSEVKVSTLGVAAVVAGNETFYGAEFANLMKALYLYSTACEALV